MLLPDCDQSDEPPPETAVVCVVPSGNLMPVLVTVVESANADVKTKKLIDANTAIIKQKSLIHICILFSPQKYSIRLSPK